MESVRRSVRRPGWASVVLLAALLGLGSGRAAAQTAAPTPSPTATPLPPAVSVTVIIQQANIRAEPSTAAEVLATAGRGTSFALLRQVGAGESLWFEVPLADGQTGWLFNTTARRAVLWRPRAQTVDGVEMVLVPPGCFIMGGNQGEPDEAPAATQCFKRPFWLDRYEVTNAAYGSAGYFSGDARPRESVNWFDAAAFCAARGARLPTEAEWEYAARGPDSLVYPWGNAFVDANAVSSWMKTARATEPIGNRPGGASWVGAYDQAGNVWEWTSSLYAPYPYDPDDGREDPEAVGLRVVRGGACCSYVIADVRAAYRFPVDPTTVDANIGFRCARDAG